MQREEQADVAARLDWTSPALRAALFEDADVTEGRINPQDGRLRLETWSRGTVVTDVVLRPAELEMWLNVVAAAHDVALGPECPTLAAQLPEAPPYCGARLQAFIPPVTPGYALVVRKRPTYTPPLEEYVARGRMPAAFCDALGHAVEDRQTIAITGGTNTGKTTLGRALFGVIRARCPEDRIVVIEDTPELFCPVDDHLPLRATPARSFRALIADALRATPTRIVLGEVRDAAALDFLDASATGHPGGFCTTHAESALGALHRLDRLAQRANVPPQPELVAEAVKLVVVLQGGNANRRVTDLVQVSGFTPGAGYTLLRCTERGQWIAA